MLTRIRVRPDRAGVKVMAFYPAAKGNEQLVGSVTCDLADLKEMLNNPRARQELRLDRQPKRRPRVDSVNID